jgi:poly-gamma-glutamate synthesis protein (capsule biosynthesis protein)
MGGISIGLVGDIIPTRRLMPTMPLNVAAYQVVSEASLSIGNFEIALSDKGCPVEKLLNMRASRDLAPDLRVLGVDVVTVANNHAVDYGWPALEDTVEALQGAGLEVVGAGPTIAQAVRPAIKEVQNRRIGIIAFSCLLPTGMAAGPNRPGISPIRVRTSYEVDPYYQIEEPGDISAVRVRTTAQQPDVEAAVRAIASLKATCETVVATIHWGFGSGDTLAEYQLPLAQALVDAGTDIVHGHHPHAVHPIGFYRGRPIFFGLGTFIGQQIFLDASPAVKALWGEMSPDGYIAQLELQPRATPTITIVPTTLDDNRLPILATGASFVRVRDRLAKLSHQYGGRIEEVEGRLRVRPAEVAA